MLILNNYFSISYNSVCARRHKHIDSSASTQLNATQIAVMTGSHWRTRNGRARNYIFYLSMLFFDFVCAKWLHKAGSNPTDWLSGHVARPTKGLSVASAAGITALTMAVLIMITIGAIWCRRRHVTTRGATGNIDPNPSGVA